MNFNIEVTDDFLKRVKNLAKKYRSIKQDIGALQQELINNPYSGVKIADNIYKVRMAIKSKGRGKSGGARVISHVDVTFADEEGTTNIVLLTIYDKSESSTASVPALQKMYENYKHQKEEE